MADTPENDLLEEYLRLFYTGWKKAYKVGWIFHCMRESHGVADVDGFVEKAKAEGYPLFPMTERDHFCNCSLFTRMVSERFSDWMFSKDPSQEKFVATVLQNKDSLKISKIKIKGEMKREKKEMGTRKHEAVESFGGKVVDLKSSHLFYNSMGRLTGKAAPTMFGVKPARVKLSRR